MDIRSNRRDADGMSAITANRLSDGLVVWRDSQGQWQERISNATPVPNEDVETLLTTLRHQAQEQGVVGVYGVQLSPDTASLEPVTAREKIRAFGPSVHPEFAPGVFPAREAHHGN
ncbi:MAG: DUF2849 domain-containing protein [Acetobacter sp.]|nr:DUF2849 domain-containing protein [Acetobacter sp.]MCH4061079.1 DUF2849 domain-containing protein [Acetobacter sp.]MCH4088018.1 DUF2849 domain-containing protein [Acetobacter sp.]MCI1293368.1 DUF2849 domain-containing protein [Acetobacter sp.]MCI1320007.1 DUF2849 domain-containing protein [Acetobacter sp.]